jgi:glycosyltransferase involved in cell wall biosynthesis
MELRSTPLSTQGSVGEGRLPALYPSPAAQTGPGTESLEAGLNVAGYFRAELGLGENGRLFVAAAKAAGEKVATISYGETVNRQDHPFEDEGERGAPYDINVICVNGDKVRGFANEIGPSFFKGRYTIGLWAWELEEFPPHMRDGFEFVDEVWAISDFTAEAIRAVSPKPVLVLPPAIVKPEVPPSVDIASLGVPATGFMFLFIFDFHSVMARKNPLGLIQAFHRAFGPGEGPVLVIKTINGHRRPAELEQLRAAAAAVPNVALLENYLDASESSSLIARCDCYISLHRSEGFGLTMAEAMAQGKPVIATGYSGNLQFMNRDNSFLVGHRLVPVPAGCGPYPQGASWAEPDLEEAARLMRAVVEHPEEAKRRALSGAREVAADHSILNRAQLVRERLDYLRSGGRDVREPLSPALGRMSAHLSQPPGESNPPTVYGRLGRLARRAVIRLTRPVWLGQRAFDQLVLQGLIDAQAELRRMRSEIQALKDRIETSANESAGSQEFTAGDSEP